MGVIRPAVNMNGWLNGWRLIIWHHLLCWSWCKMILIALFSNCITCLCCQAKEASEHPIKVTGRLWFVMLRKHDPLGKQQVFLSLQNCPEWSHLQLKMILASVFEEVFLDISVFHKVPQLALNRHLGCLMPTLSRLALSFSHGPRQKPKAAAELWCCLP